MLTMDEKVKDMTENVCVVLVNNPFMCTLEVENEESQKKSTLPYEMVREIFKPWQQIWKELKRKLKNPEKKKSN